MLEINEDCYILKEYKGTVEVDGINIYDSSSVQYRLYEDEEVLYTVNDEPVVEKMFYVFPITSGITLFGDYCILNQKDCIAHISMTDIENMYNGEY